MKRSIFVLAAGMLVYMFCPASAGASGGSPSASLSSVEPAPVYRFWSPVLGTHCYTIQETEKTKLLSQYAQLWTYEGIAFRAFPSHTVDNLAPVHRFWSTSLRSHFYTVDEVEKDKLIRDYPEVWTYEGVAFYAYAAGQPPAGTMPVYRFWSGSLGAHFYTTSDTERFKLVSSYAGVWAYEAAAWYAYPPQAVTSVTFIAGPCVQWIASDSATVMWQTDVPAESVVHYGIGTPEAFAVSDPTAATLHRLALTGLDPNVVYTYRASSGPASQTGTFSTAPPADQSLRFVVYGDTRTDVQVHRKISAAIGASGASLVFHTGDLVSSGRDYGLWGMEFFEPAGGLMQSTPLVPVPGNHEYGGVGPLWFFYFFDRPLNEAWFAMTYGNIRFLGLDTNLDYAAGSPQHNWLVQEFQSASYRDATWHVVIFHHPPFTCTLGHSDDTTVRSQLVPLFEQYGVDVVFSGHSHAYERYSNNGIPYIVTGGGGGPLYELPVDTVPPIRQFGLSTYHYCVVDVDPAAGTFTMAAIDLNGQTFDTLKLSQPQ